MEKTNNPKETICLLTYEKPLNVGEICTILYDKKHNSRVSGWLNELSNKGCLEIHFDKKDAKFRLCQATSKCFVESIKKDIELKPVEEKVLLDLFATDVFRSMMGYMVSKVGYRDGFAPIKEYLGYFAVYFYTMADYSSGKVEKAYLSDGIKSLKNISVDNFNAITPKHLHVTEDEILDQYVFFFIDFAKKMNTPLLNKLVKLNKHSDMLLLLAASLLTWKKTVDLEIKRRKPKRNGFRNKKKKTKKKRF